MQSLHSQNAMTGDNGPVMADQTVKSWGKAYAESAEAPSWLVAHHWTYGPDIVDRTAADVRSKLELTPDDQVLEVGSGTGAFLMAVLHQGQSGWGLDLCESLVKAGPRLGVDQKRIRVGVAEGFRLPIASNSFDKVLCYGVSQHFPNHDYARQCMAELVRVCRVGGVVLMGDVCGILEGRRRALIRRGLPPLVADSILLPLLPIRYLRWLPLQRRCAHWLRSYRRSFFVRALRNLPCSFEILDQEIPGRNESAGRFDVRIRKTGGAVLAACLAGVFIAMSSQTWAVVLQQIT